VAGRSDRANVTESEQGIDAAKKIEGRERHIVTGTLGLLLAVVVTAASVSDTAGGRDLIDVLAAEYPTVSKVWVDGGYQVGMRRKAAAHRIQVETVTRNGEKGFHVLPRRWVVERTFGWLMQHRRLARDYEALPQRSRSMLLWAMANTMSRRLAGDNWALPVNLPS
jgi:transposase